MRDRPRERAIGRTCPVSWSEERLCGLHRKGRSRLKERSVVGLRIDERITEQRIVRRIWDYAGTRLSDCRGMFVPLDGTEELIIVRDVPGVLAPKMPE